MLSSLASVVNMAATSSLLGTPPTKYISNSYVIFRQVGTLLYLNILKRTDGINLGDKIILSLFLQVRYGIQKHICTQIYDLIFCLISHQLKRIM
jgi:hypothetical protein